MTLDQLKILESIVEAGSLRKAAKVLFRTQPTVVVASSMAILALFSTGRSENK